eukprot:gene5741-7142_t
MEPTNLIKDYSNFLSSRGKNKEVSPVRAYVSFPGVEKMISLAGGLPNPKTFPFKSITIELKDNSKLEITGSELETALNYSNSYGLAKLTSWIKQLQIRTHSLSTEKQWEVCVSTGSQSAIAMAMEVIFEEGDSIITEEPTYSGTLPIIRPMGLNIVGVEVDQFGMIPEKLESVLSNWDAKAYPFPKGIYLIPSGQNPSGSTMTTERKELIYQIASRYNLLILEDDPYYFLQFGQSTSGDGKLSKSFLSMDVDGRVLRFDSFSKILSSGIRIGFVTGNPFMIDKIQLQQQCYCLHPCGVSQTIAYKLLTSWGFEQWDKHIEMVQSFYKTKRDAFESAAKKHLTGLAEFVAPSAGMFFWIKLIGIQDTTIVAKKLRENDILMIPGISFSTKKSPSSYMRASFSTATEDNFDIALSKMAQVLKELIQQQQQQQ